MHSFKYRSEKGLPITGKEAMLDLVLTNKSQDLKIINNGTSRKADTKQINNLHKGRTKASGKSTKKRNGAVFTDSRKSKNRKQEKSKQRSKETLKEPLINDIRKYLKLNQRRGKADKEKQKKPRMLKS